jgi:RNA polymerase sigma-70 factor (ECF subfamily)
LALVQGKSLVRYWCLRWGVPASDLDDLVQDVWVGLYPTLPSYQAGLDRSFRAWLRGITRHKTQDWHRKRARQPAEAIGGTAMVELLRQIESDIDLEEAEDSGEQAERKALYHRALMELRDEFENHTWRAFLATALEGRSPADVGTELGVTAAAVRKAKSRVLGRLRLELGEPPGGPESRKPGP